MGVLMEIMKSSGKTMEFADKAVGSTSSSDKSKYNPERRNEASAVRGASRNYGSDDAFLSLWDMGGHRSFQASHNVFLSAHGVYLLVFRLTDFLRDKLETDRLKRWIRLIGTFSKDELTAPNLRSKRIQAPPIIFVGTFLDELKKEYNNYKKQIASINRSITKFPELSSLHFVRFCTVDNSLSNDHRELHILRGFITEAAEHQDQWERELPTTWLKLELDLYQARETGTKILTLEEVVNMNKTSLAPLKDEDEIKLALEYLHSIRSVIYFREFDYVINDPQWLADFFSILITDDYFLPSYDPLLNRDLELYKTKGELTQKLIKGLLCMKKNEAYAPFESILLALMEKFGLIVKILLSEHATENTQFSATYTIPSKLSELQNIDGITDEVNALKHRNLAVSKTLCFVFGDIYVPYELFHRIFAKILRTYRATSLSARSLEEAAEGGESTAETTDCLYMDFGCFEVNDIFRIILSMHAERSTIAVTVFSPTESRLPVESGKNLRLSIERILRETMKMSNQEHFHYSHQLHCNFHLSPYDTPVQLYGIIHSERGVSCKGGECQGQHRLSRDDIEYWGITEVSTRTVILAGTALVDKNIPERRPTPRELGRLSRLVGASSCEMLFIELGISGPEIEHVKQESSRLAAITQITKMFLRWTNAYPNQTFNDIANAMKNVKMAIDRIPEVIEVNEESSCRGIVPNEVWSRAPSDDEITEIVDNIDKAFFNLCLELGLSPPVIDQHVLCHPVNFQDRMGALLRCWIKKFQRQATIGRLLTAMEVCQMDWHTTAQIWSRCQEKPTTHHRRRHRLKCSIV
ncbi:uncharacterized protein LOC117320521 [Pecten maximus]|uniref:uncharacterized protein LOC117320521 n=1 Tax=Pecten maximus TaxID=6579 RepID=UPI001458F48C|nr:uncharacterized protein LOC117320521 [Pecten maximus]XP_033730990.1 uncharacterized protein LOC117320521 [Pecten maximus]